MLDTDTLNETLELEQDRMGEVLTEVLRLVSHDPSAPGPDGMAVRLGLVKAAVDAIYQMGPPTGRELSDEVQVWASSAMDTALKAGLHQFLVGDVPGLSVKPFIGSA